ncbi:hypothetical protein [uncultured Fibrobacter sp.]|uniref:hypothetical protein n=1 Tax=uncultured Fibrobacter sp. TaxID=261512 RepID=UPI0025E6273D|nr:hypothetical protein [uncultured Fibrobacter sp.]
MAVFRVSKIFSFSEKVNYKWSIRGFMGNSNHKSLKGKTREYKDDVNDFKNLFKRTKD